jgi:hypothetical protein
MLNFNLPLSSGTILVVGFIYNIDKLNKIQQLAKDYKYVIINGGLSENLTQINNNILYVQGRVDYLNNINNYPNLINIKYNSRNVIITDGGIINTLNTYENSFINQINGKPWHNNYNGSLGYVISNNTFSDSPKYYNYSMSLGSCEKTFAQEVNEIGLRKMFEI